MDTGQEPVVDYAFLASPARQQVVFRETLNDKLVETDPGYGYEFDPGNGYGFNSTNKTAEKIRAQDSSYYPLYSLNYHGNQFDKSHGCV